MLNFSRVIWVISFLLASAVLFNQCRKESAFDNMILIEGGTFMMGSPEDDPGRYENEIQNLVSVSSFYIGKYTVTQRDYEKVIRNNPSHFKGKNLPVEMVSWYDAVEFCNKLSRREGLTPVYIIEKNKTDLNNINGYDDVGWLVSWKADANGYRLPTEAEWEYACRAGTTTFFNTGNNIGPEDANFNWRYEITGSDLGEYGQITTEVGSYTANPWGLYDMHGNVWEWCWDWYNSQYEADERTDPKGPEFGSSRVERGGAWHNHRMHVRSAYRGSLTPSMRGEDLGFRLVRSKL
jgi:formylglycine-generating enzyme required for sulfatase activity